MTLSRELMDPSLVLTAGLAFISAILLIVTVPRPHVVRPLRVPDGLLIGAAIGCAALLSALITMHLAGALVAAALAGAVCALVRKGMPRLTAVGVIHTALAPIALISGAAWAYMFVTEQDLPGWTSGLVIAGASVALLAFGFRFAASLVEDAVYTHARWTRPTHALPPRGIGEYAPKVSIHVPCYAEPPEVVLQTLQRLADLRYPNYEVIVCDNNTPDEELWRPLQRFCMAQNIRAPGRFRFYHVAPLQGAKAGALNYCLERTAADVELVAVVDADYLAEPDFLSRLSGFFANPKIGFIQTPHDYRRDGSAYQAMCYWEYMPPNKIGLAALNEYDCAYTIGTMCILRKDAIAEAGGWAEWCLTEDSEISIRIRALGYEGIYVNETFGRGLIPETYEDLKKQRFRWTAGPVQQLLAHWRLFLPKAMGGSPIQHRWVKLLEVNRSVAPLLEAAGFLSSFATLALVFAVSVSGIAPQMNLPAAFWVAAGLGSGAGVARLWRQYSMSGCTSPLQILGAEAAKASLAYIRTVAVVAALTGRPLKWRRTPKFAASSSTARALYACAPEIALALAFAFLMQAPLHNVAALGGHAATLAILGCAASALTFLASPLMALLSEVRLRALGAADGAEKSAEEIVEPALPRAA